MLNLAEFLGLCPLEVRRLPSVVYFHENQLTYPRRRDDPRDLHFAFTNMTTGLAADRVWFNSAFHRRSFLGALGEWLKRMPDHRPTGVVRRIRDRSEIHYPGVAVAVAAERSERTPGPLRILWAARWEHDKDPDTFFRALYQLQAATCPFRVSVLGQSFGDVPACFDLAAHRLADQIDRWGYLPDRQDYLAALCAADVFVSTAQHEFFGIAAVEAALAGCYPLLPDRLAYPELLRDHRECLYDGTLEGLVHRLHELAGPAESGQLAREAEPVAADLARFQWHNVAQRMDDAIDELVRANT